MLQCFFLSTLFTALMVSSKRLHPDAYISFNRFNGILSSQFGNGKLIAYLPYALLAVVCAFAPVVLAKFVIVCVIVGMLGCSYPFASPSPRCLGAQTYLFPADCCCCISSSPRKGHEPFSPLYLSRQSHAWGSSQQFVLRCNNVSVFTDDDALVAL